MAKIEITENMYNTTCDTYGCGNIAKFVVGKEGEGQAQKTLICEECMQGIINQAPLDMILDRVEAIQVAETDEEENIDYNSQKFNNLKDLAVKKGFEFKVGTTKAQLIEYLEGK